MGKFKFKLDKKGVESLLKSQGAASLVEPYADAVQGAAGDGYEKKQYVTREKNGGRVGYVVYPATPKAVASNNKNNTLVKAMGAAKR